MKKAILAVSVGRTYEEARRITIGRIEEKIRAAFPAYEVRSACTSKATIKTLNTGIAVGKLEGAIEGVISDGFRDITVQPLLLIPGIEYDYLRKIVSRCQTERSDINIRLGRPALNYEALENTGTDDYIVMIKALQPHLKEDKAMLFMAHGTSHTANICYAKLSQTLKSHGYNRTYIACIKGYPSIEDIIKILKEDKVVRVKLIPFMLTSGYHVKKDMIGEDSWESSLTKEGFIVEACLMGLGELDEIQDIYIQHIREALK
ncbi:sirohydrochlorin cobaltochelatase [Clostridium thermarum]|uniref:sirohydrochlorin cobaltochelatase n=1 Tax=Clostridium thermarum TaxID=1716543 RepID=UPI0013CF9C64|nr:sirohydrochlorin cobaltochelatase [Clostridium thermarum]